MPEQHDTDSLAQRNQLLSEEIRRRVDQLTAINTVAATVSQSLDLQATLKTALEAVLGVIKVDSAGISLVDEAAGELVLRAQRGWRYDFVTEPMRIPLGQGMSGIAVHNDEVVITGEITREPRLAVPEFADEGIKAMALVPMHARGRVVGILSVMHHEQYEFTPEEITVLRAIADQVGVALDNAALYENTQEQHSRLSAVLDSTADAIIATDNYGHINLINATAEDLFKLREEDVIGLPLRDAPLHPKVRNGLRQAMSEGDGRGNMIFEVALEDGRFLSAIVSRVYAARSLERDQEPEGWVIVIQDVTHLREAEQARVNFIHAAAHDLRNPLGVTMNALKMLERDLEETQQPSAYSREIVSIGIQSLNRMQDLIDSLLNLEHIQSGVGLKCVPVDVHDWVERAVIDMQPSVQEGEHTLRLDLPDTLPPINGDMQWLYRALINLISNAIKYTPHGGEITVRAYVHDSELHLEVRDNGCGIPPEAQTRLFERFYRAPGVEQIKGSGLGLSIVKSVVEQHGGRVYVQSKVEQGSTFGMIFPPGKDLSCRDTDA
ncbi:MAG: GAF domain-containing protein [Anaerolineae bacterium]|nr:GAF domain-containing protein [Anaerolineae bacterium]